MTIDNYDFIDVENKYIKKWSDRNKYEDFDFITDTGGKANLFSGDEDEMSEIYEKIFSNNDIIRFGSSQKDYGVEIVLDNGEKGYVPLLATKEQAESFGVGNNVVFDYPFITNEGEDKLYYLPLPNNLFARHKKFFFDSLATVDANPHLNWFDFEVTAKVTTKQKVDTDQIALGVGEITQTVIASNRLKAEEAFERFVDKVHNGKIIQISNVRKIRTIKPYKRKAA